MFKINLLWPGKTKEPWIRQGIDFYIKRLKNFYQVNIIETRAVKHKKKDEIIKREEEYLKQALLKVKGKTIILDLRGKSMSSTAFADFIKKEQELTGIALTFIVGGAYGLSKDLLKTADLVLSLSEMTFTHEMTRLILAEQLYRAATIIKGSPYHH